MVTTTFSMDQEPSQRLRDVEVAITGRLASMSRAEAIRAIREAGGRYVESPMPSTRYVVVGGDGPALARDGRPTRALEEAQELRHRGHPIETLSEPDFVALLRPAEATVHQGLYTIAQLSRILNVPVGRIRGWMRQELIRPVKVVKRLCFFDFRQVASARRLQQLTHEGITPARIRRSLLQISDWLGQPDPAIDQLEVLEDDGRLAVRLEDGRLADPSGQLLLDFDGREPTDEDEPRETITMQPRTADAEEWFRVGIRAEEQGEHQNAIEAYQRAIDLGEPKPEVCFNLGNAFYALERTVEAAACFLQATEIDGDYVEAWNNLGNTMAELGKHHEAIRAYQKALAVAPHYADAHYNLAEALAVTSDLEGAREHWQAYLRQDPHSQWAARVRDRLEELP